MYKINPHNMGGVRKLERAMSIMLKTEKTKEDMTLDVIKWCKVKGSDVSWQLSIPLMLRAKKNILLQILSENEINLESAWLLYSLYFLKIILDGS